MSKKKGAKSGDYSIPNTLGGRLQMAKRFAQLDLPNEVRAIFPEISIHGDQICFSDSADYVTREEAVGALVYLLEQLKAKD